MPIVDVAFRLQGSEIPADHGYLLFAAVTDLVPGLHEDESVGILPVSGRLAGDRQLSITEFSRLTIRLDADRIAQVLPLAGKRLRLGDAALSVGVPEVRALVPAARLYSRLVVIKGFMEPEPFLGAVQRQLDTLGVKGKASLVPQPAVAATNAESATGSHSPVLRRTLRIRDKEIVGFALRVEELNAEESIRLQEHGIGGRRRFGCGVFIPDKRERGEK